MERSSSGLLFAAQMNLRKDGRLKSAKQCRGMITKEDTVHTLHTR